MNDAEYNEIRDRVLDHLQWWLHYLGLSQWEWEVTWYRDTMGWPGGSPDRGNGNAVIMQIDAKPQYMALELDVNVPAIGSMHNKIRGMFSGDEAENEIDRRIEAVVVHELCHCFMSMVRHPDFESPVSRSWDEYMQHEELTTTLLQKAFVWIANHGSERPRKVNERKRAAAAKRRARKLAAGKPGTVVTVETLGVDMDTSKTAGAYDEPDD